MATEKDIEQDILIRQNAEHIRRNEESIRRQTDALEKIRDHYFPRKTLPKRAMGFFLKAVGAVTVAAGLLETADWYWNERRTEGMARQSAAVARRLLFKENNVVGAAKFLTKAVELDGSTVEYRIMLAYIKGLSAISELFDIGRPLTEAERGRIDEILAEAVFLQEVAPDEAMPYVLAAQVYGLRGERALAVSTAERAVALDPANVQARVTVCAMRFFAGDVAGARDSLAEAERIDPAFPLVMYWKALFALRVDKDSKTALAHIDALLQRAPRLPLAHLLRGKILMDGTKAGIAAARTSCERALTCAPGLSRAMVQMAETYEQEGNVVLARLWLDRAIEKDAHCMAALVARARLGGKTEIVDLTAAITLAPFRADLYRARAEAYARRSDEASAASDRQTSAMLEASQQHEIAF